MIRSECTVYACAETAEMPMMVDVKGAPFTFVINVCALCAGSLVMGDDVVAWIDGLRAIVHSVAVS